MYAVLADLLLFLHLGYVAFVIVGLLLVWLGGALGWPFVRHPWFRLLHLAAIAIVAAEAVAGVTCPMTIWETDLRIAAGQTTEDLGLISRLARDILFIDGMTDAELRLWCIGFLCAVVASFFLVPVRWRRD